MSSGQGQIAVPPNVHNLATSQKQKDYSEDLFSRQNIIVNPRSRANMKGKHLTRSHAMRETASPPRTPTPRTDQQIASTNCGLTSLSSSSSSSPSSSAHSPSQDPSDCKTPNQSNLLSPTPLLETPSVIVTSQLPQQQQQQNVICNEADFPKLSPPKSSKCPRNTLSNTNCITISNNRDVMDKYTHSNQPCDSLQSGHTEHCNKMEFSNGSNGKKVVLEVTKTTDSGGCSNSSGFGTCNSLTSNPIEINGNGMHCTHSDAHISTSSQEGIMTVYDKENRCPRNDSQNSNNSLSPDENQNSLTDSPSDMSKHDRVGKKHRTNSNSKGTKPRLKNMGSSSSMDGGNSNSTSGFISRDSSTEHFTDQSGVDLLLFFKETLNKNPKDRNTLMKIEKELTELAQDKTRSEMRFPSASSYNRMLIHRTAAYFGMEHNVDTATQQCVIVGTTKGTRLPDIRFKSLLRDRMTDEPRKSILKRDTHSFDETRQGYLCPDRGTLDRKAKSFEEREEEYEKVRRRIFRNRENGDMNDEPYWTWADNCEQSSKMRPNNKTLKVQSACNDSRSDGRPNVPKSHSFGGYGGPPMNSNNGSLLRGDSVNSTKSAGSRMFSKQDSIGSTNTTWRLSPSSSGSIYHFDPSNLPPSQAMASGMYNKSQLSVNMKKKQEKHKLCSRVDHPAGTEANASSSSSGDTTVHNSKTESSIETMSESSTQTVMQIPADRDEAIDSKDSIINRGMDDIQEETNLATAEDCEKKPIADNTEKTPDRIEVQKFKHQATSPNIPIPDQEGPTHSNESIVQNESKTDAKIQHSTTEASNSNSSTPASTSECRKDEPKHWNYTQSYQALDGSTVFQTNSGNPYSGTTYQQGPDGSVYAVPPGMLYAYPPPMEGEMQGYFMPIFDPAQQRDPNGLIPAGSQAIYQPAGGATMLPVASYPTAQFPGAPLYPGQVLYSSDQFAPGGTPVAAAANSQMQQYPLTTYPIGYPYPYNGYWGQTMAYYVPQQSITNALPPSILPSTAAPLQPPNGVTPSIATPSSQITTNNHSSALSNNNPIINGVGVGSRGKRATPPHHQQNNIQGNNHSLGPGNPAYQLGHGVPLALASDINGSTMYAIPQPAVFSSNILPYTHQGTPTSANAPGAAGVLTPLSHQPNTVISSIFNHPPLPGNNGHIPLDQSGQPAPPANYTVHTNGGSNHPLPPSGTPQSAPSTPHGLSHHNQRNPPLFATPPINPSNFNSPIQSHYQSFTDSQYGGVAPHVPHSYDKRNNSGTGNNKNKSLNSSGFSSTARQNSSQLNNNINNKTTSSSDITSNQSSQIASNGIPTQQRSIHLNQQKRINGGDKPHSSPLNGPHMGQGNASHNSNHNPLNSSDTKPRISSGYRQKPNNIEFRRSVSQRNSPSANSNESNNNSPNSIVSNYTGGYNGGHNSGGIPPYASAIHDNQPSPPVFIARGPHLPPIHASAASAQAAAVVAAAAANEASGAGCPPPLIGAYNHPGAPTGVYIKYGQTYFAHPTVALPNNRRSPPSDLRPQMAPITGMYPAMNMMISAPRQLQPRHPNPNYKGNRPSR